LAVVNIVLYAYRGVPLISLMLVGSMPTI